MTTLRMAAGLIGLLLAAPLLAVPLKIACIGDSITEGSGLSNPSTEAYPAKLQRLLGTNYVVKNYGVSGRTLLKKGDYPYWKEAAFKASHDYGPDIVTIKLGTNDSKPYNWKYSTNFVSDFEELIASYTNLASHPFIYLVTPCPVYNLGAYDIKPAVVANEIAPAVRELAAKYGLGLIDMHTMMAGHKEWFPDTVHPNSAGTTVMAAIMRRGLVGDNPAGTPPSLQLRRPTASRSILTWSGDWAGLVLQTTTAIRTNTTWTVLETPAWYDGSLIRVTNTTSNALRLYRLWQPW